MHAPLSTCDSRLACAYTADTQKGSTVGPSAWLKTVIIHVCMHVEFVCLVTCSLTMHIVESEQSCCTHVQTICCIPSTSLLVSCIGLDWLWASLSGGGASICTITVSGAAIIQLRPVLTACALLHSPCQYLLILRLHTEHCHSCNHPVRLRWPENGICRLSGP